MKHYAEPNWLRIAKQNLLKFKEKVKTNIDKRIENFRQMTFEYIEAFDKREKYIRKKPELTETEKLLREVKFIKCINILILAALVILNIAYFRIVYQF